MVSEFFVKPEDGLDYGSREYSEKYGFGITTGYFSQSDVGPELVGHNNEDQSGSDPNQAIVEAMDEATQMAYIEALYGPPKDLPPDEMSEEEAVEFFHENFDSPSGCIGEGLRLNMSVAFSIEFDDEIEELRETAFQDPRIQEKHTELIDCVNEDGHGLTVDKQIWQTIDARYRPQLDKIRDEIGGLPGETLTEEDFATMSDEELEEVLSQPQDVPPEAKDKLAVLQKEEVTIALKYFDCGGSQDELQGLYGEVLEEYEERFLEDNADRLAQYKAEP